MLNLHFLSPDGEEEFDSRIGLVMNWTQADGIEALENLRHWALSFAVHHCKVRACVFSSQGPPKESLASAGLPLPCWHVLEIPPPWDRYIRSETLYRNRFNENWSPWGFKSGPNFQFFEVLSSYPHEHEYIFQLEGDTVLVGGGISVEELWCDLEKAKLPWVFGAFNPGIVERRIDSSIRGHVNGAALYRVGHSEMTSFVETVWKDSLIAGVARDPHLAYDVLSAPQQWEWLPDQLARAWRQTQEEFVRSPRMINASIIFELPRYVLQILKETNEFHNPWFLHYGRRTRSVKRSR